MYMSRDAKIKTSFIFIFLFLVLMLLLKFVDIGAIGPEETSVGFAGVNGFFSGIFSFNKTWYFVSNVTDVFMFGLAGFFVLVGFLQLIGRKSLFKVDKEILVLAGLYAITVVLYIVFDKIVINYRPVLLPGEDFPESSFPSSHTLMAIVVFGSSFILFGRYLHGAGAKVVLQILCVLLILLVIVSRFLSGVHWFTDILGGIFLGLGLVFAYGAAIHKEKRRRRGAVRG